MERELDTSPNEKKLRQNEHQKDITIPLQARGGRGGGSEVPDDERLDWRVIMCYVRLKTRLGLLEVFRAVFRKC